MTASEAHQTAPAPRQAIHQRKTRRRRARRHNRRRQPATGELLTTVPDGQAADIDRAVAAARASFERKSWRGMDPSKKEKILWDVSEILLKHREELADPRIFGERQDRARGRRVRM